MGDNEYIPGVCNLGTAEIRKRQRSIGIGIAVSVITATILLATGIERNWRWAIAIPVGYLSINVLQVYFKFCIVFGLFGLYNFKELGNIDRTLVKEQIKQDRVKTLLITGWSLLLTFVVTFLFYLL